MERTPSTASLRRASRDPGALRDSEGSAGPARISTSAGPRRTWWSRTGSVHTLALTCVVVAAAVAVAVLFRPDAPPAEAAADLPAYPTLEEGGLRYEYDALTDSERLLDVRNGDANPADVSAERPADLERLREKLLRSLGVGSLETIHAAHRDVADALRRLGYL